MANQTRLREVGIDLAVEFFGSICIAVGIYNFAVHAEFPMTGFSGVAMIVNRLTGFPIGIMTILLNLPVAAVCCRTGGSPGSGSGPGGGGAAAGGVSSSVRPSR